LKDALYRYLESINLHFPFLYFLVLILMVKNIRPKGLKTSRKVQKKKITKKIVKKTKQKKKRKKPVAKTVSFKTNTPNKKTNQET
jgi:hypothetical protein